MGHCDATFSVLRFIILEISKTMKWRASTSLAGRRTAKQNAHSVPFWNQMSEKSRLICLHHHGRIDPSCSLCEQGLQIKRHMGGSRIKRLRGTNLDIQFLVVTGKAFITRRYISESTNSKCHRREKHLFSAMGALHINCAVISFAQDL